MADDAALETAAHLNFVASFRKLAEHTAGGAVRQFGGVFAFTTGLPLSMFNGCVVVDAAGREDLRAAIRWVAGRALPHRVWISEPLADGLAVALDDSGLQPDPRPYPGMALRPVRVPSAPRPGIAVRPVRDRPDLERHRAVLAGAGLSLDVARSMLTESFAFDADVRLFTAWLDGRPAGTSIAIRSGAVSGVYAVMTRADARRRGVGTATTWAAVAAGRDWGCRTIVLQASAMGESVYRTMGFRTVVRYTEFRPPG